MRCLFCKKADTEAGTATVMLERDGMTLVVKNVVACVCPNCGEEYVEAAATTRLLEVAERAAQADVQVDVREYIAA